jgi:prepilin-type N-terminal cleavage/methylation domain-containing protein
VSDRRSGWTIIELMIVVAIIGVMCANAADFVRGIAVPEARHQAELSTFVDQQRLLAQLRADLDHAADVVPLPGSQYDPVVLITSAFRSRPDVRYIRTPLGLARHAGGRVTEYRSWRLGSFERIAGPGGVLVKIPVKPSFHRASTVIVSRLIFPDGAR